MLIKKFDLRDRGDGVEIRVSDKANRTRFTLKDDEAAELAEAILDIVESDDRPVMEGEHVIYG